MRDFSSSFKLDIFGFIFRVTVITNKFIARNTLDTISCIVDAVSTVSDLASVTLSIDQSKSWKAFGTGC